MKKITLIMILMVIKEKLQNFVGMRMNRTQLLLWMLLG